MRGSRSSLMSGNIEIDHIKEGRARTRVIHIHGQRQFPRPGL